MGALNILGVTGKLWLRALPRTAPIAAVPAGAGVAGLALLEQQMIASGARSIPLAVAWLFTIFLAHMVALSAMTRVMDAVHRKEPVSLARALQSSIAPAGWLLLAGLLMLAVVIVMTPALHLVLTTIAPQPHSAVLGVTYLSFLALYGFVLARVAPALTMLVVDRDPLPRAIARAWVYTRSFRIGAATSALVVVLFLSIVPGLLGLALMSVTSEPLVFKLVIALMNTVFGAVPAALSVSMAANRGS